METALRQRYDADCLPCLPHILESNPHPNLIRTIFCRILQRKKKVSSRF